MVQAATDAEFDLFVTGPVFLDIIFTGLQEAPVGGREVLTSGMGSSPGKTNVMAVAPDDLHAHVLLHQLGDREHARPMRGEIAGRGQQSQVRGAQRAPGGNQHVTRGHVLVGPHDAAARRAQEGVAEHGVARRSYLPASPVCGYGPPGLLTCPPLPTTDYQLPAS